MQTAYGVTEIAALPVTRTAFASQTEPFGRDCESDALPVVDC